MIEAGQGRTAYISGPMSGLTDHNYPEFDRVAARWTDHGWAIFNPANNFGGLHTVGAPEEGGIPIRRDQFMRQDIHNLLQTDAIVMLDGWEKSKGATLEFLIAIELDLAIYSEHGELFDVALMLEGPLYQMSITILPKERVFLGNPSVEQEVTNVEG